MQKTNLEMLTESAQALSAEYDRLTDKAAGEPSFSDILRGQPRTIDEILWEAFDIVEALAELGRID